MLSSQNIQTRQGSLWAAEAPETGRTPLKKGTFHNGLYMYVFFPWASSLPTFIVYYEQCCFQVFGYLRKVTNVLNMATSVNNCYHLLKIF